jgi:predicted AlkP superfamily pyrophosphatase or phosphodiesterase
MHFTFGNFSRVTARFFSCTAIFAFLAFPSSAQTSPVASSPPAAARATASRPKLVVIIVVDQMRGDYIDRFQHQWTGGLKRLVQQGAWFHQAAYPYANTETCVGHSTISTGAFPATHGMVTNEWWDRDQKKLVTCTSDPNAKNIPYPSGSPGTSPSASTVAQGSASAAPSPGDSAAKLLVPSFAEELKFQSGDKTRIVTMSLKARAAITLAGHRADSVTWFDGISGNWITSSAFPQSPVIAEFAKAHPVNSDFGKTWSPLFPESTYLYEKTAFGAGPPPGYGNQFPHPLRGAQDTKSPDPAYYLQWATSPYAETYLARMAETAVDRMHLGNGAGTDFLGISFSSVDYVGHMFGPRSWEIQDELARLDKDLGELFTHLDKAVGHDNYIVAFSADHGVSPIPEEVRKNGIDAGRLNTEQVKVRIEQALEPLHFPKNPVVEVGGADVYFSPEVAAKLQGDSRAVQAVIDAISSVPGVLHVYTAAEVSDRPATKNPMRDAEAAGFFPSRSGDLLIVPKPYWVWDYSPVGQASRGGTSHGTPYYYDQRVPVIFMGWGIRLGKYFVPATPADIAPTLAALCAVTLAPRDGHTLQDAIAQTKSTSPAASHR